jgi:hypothetical protein
MVTPVIFRIDTRKQPFPTEVAAVFPTKPYSNDGDTMTCYIKPYSDDGCSLAWYAQNTRAAKPCEYAELLATLKTEYTDLRIYSRMTYRHREEFLLTARAKQRR